ncbi:MAG: peptidoglycan domain protein [Paludibacter sp.]|nr:peptidoglycan domain protein [Paludibacter sp.]
MTDVNILAKFILKWEGGFVNNPNDPGGATNKGVTIAVWKAQGYDKNGDGRIDVNDLKLITDADAIKILKSNYWNRWFADKITSQAVANTLVDWVWGSGAWGIKIPQRLLGLKENGIVDYVTLNMLNNRIIKDKEAFLQDLYKARYQYLNDIVKKNPKLQVFFKGWNNRMNDLVKFNKQFN